MDDAYLRYPTLAGEVLAFVADDDVWVAAAAGGDAWRLTSRHAPVRNARLSPDGSQVAYAAVAGGRFEVHVAELSGGRARQLTWWGDDSTAVLGWTPGSEVVAVTAAGEPSRNHTWAWALPAGGGPGRRLPYGPLSALSWGEGGALLAGVDQSLRRGAAWKRYRGGTAAKMWVDRDGSGHFDRLGAAIDGQLEDPQWCGGRVVFVSDHEGCGNVYSCAADGSGLRRHSDHDRFYARAAAGDGTRVAYQCAGELWRLDDLDPRSQPVRIDLRLRSAHRPAPVVPVDVAGDLHKVAPDRDGLGALLEVRGAVSWLPLRGGPARVVAAGGASRGRLPSVLGSGATAAAAWVDDGGGADAVAVAPLDGPPGEQRSLGAGQLGVVVELAASPDGARVATASHDGWVRITEVASGESIDVDRSGHDPATGLAWSPDGQWLAWSHAGPVTPAEAVLRQIRVARASGGEVVEATPMRFNDREPVWTPDGKFLAFLSTRTFDPVYDETLFDVGFPAATRPYLLRLAAATPSPTGPEAAQRPVAPAPAQPAPAQPGAPAAEGESGKVPAVVVDTEGLGRRLVTLPVPAGRLSGLVATAGGLAWRSQAVAGSLGDSWADPAGPPPPARLDHIDLASLAVTTLLAEADAVDVTAGGRALLVRRGRDLRVVPADRAAPASPEPGDDATLAVDLSRLHLEVDPAAEWAQMLAETARLQANLFWVQDMGGVDWDEVVGRYRPLVSAVSTRDELSELMWEMQGELGASHAYEMPPERPADPALAPGWLGADLDVHPSGGWLVDRVVPAEPSVPAARSPLAEAGVREGELVVAVGGRRLAAGDNPSRWLAGLAGAEVELTVRDQAGSERRVPVRCLAGERALRYHDWVAGRRSAVHEAGGGRVGYVHVPDLSVAGWGQLHRDLRTEIRAEALVVDLRGNGGGHLSPLVLERLAQTVTAWTVTRDYEPYPYPADVPRGPLVAVIDQNAGSDGDIISAGFRQRRLGPLVGMRTWGGVIGIDGRFRLADGTLVTQPRYAFWFDGGAGWGVENHGVDPDLEVPFAPHDWAAGRDPQLDAAVRAALDALGRAEPVRPAPAAERPDRSQPPLPPRPAAG